MRVRSAITLVMLLIAMAVCDVRTQGQVPSQAQLLQEGLTQLEAQGDARKAAETFERAAHGPNRTVAARARLYTGIALEKLGQQEARRHYERVVREFGDQPEVVAAARARLEVLARSAPAPPRPAPTVTVRRTWSQEPPGIAWFGAMSRNGQALAYGDRDGAILVAEANGGTSPRVFVSSDPSVGPAIAVPAPDGTAVLVQRMNDRKEIELRAYRQGGAPQTLLTLKADEAIAGVEWTSREFICVQVQRPDRRATVHVVNAANGTSKEIASLQRTSSRVALSPDGRWLSYDALADTAGNGLDLFVKDVVSGDVARMEGGPGDDGMPVWTSRGDFLLFVSDRTGTLGLWGVPMRGGARAGETVLLQPEIGRVAKLIGVSDANDYHYLRQTGLVDVYTVPLDDEGRPTSPPVRAARRDVGSNMGPGFSPDGLTLAFLAQMGMSGTEAIALLDLEGGTQRTVATGMPFLRLPRWSPDGVSLLVKGQDASGRYGLHLLDPRDGRTTSLVTVTDNRESALGTGRWASDGQSVLYTQWVDGRLALRRVRVAGGEDETLFTLDRAMSGAAFDLSPLDGSIAYISTHETRWAVVVRTTEGESRELAAFDEAGSRPIGVTWAPDGRALWLVRRTPGDAVSNSVWRLTVDGGRLEPLGLEMPHLRELAVSPDGRRLAFTAGAPTREPWVVEHFLPAPAGAAARTRR